VKASGPKPGASTNFATFAVHSDPAGEPEFGAKTGASTTEPRRF
jgi:hypothetical protein